MEENKIIRVAAGIIGNDKGQVLIGERKDMDFWEFPGGKCEYGENPFACLVRELSEELSFDLKASSKETDFLAEYISEREDYDLVIYFYMLKIDCDFPSASDSHRSLDVVHYKDFDKVVFLKTNVAFLKQDQILDKIQSFFSK